LIDWAKSNNFAVSTDKAQNLLIKVPGYDNAPIVILQGHLDMVCEKTPDSKHDFSKDPIKHIYDGKWLTADKTTLGADNGIAIAMAMTLALEKNHPPLELLFTVNEETGLNGATDLDPELFDGRILINIDSEEEGVVTVGCAGGINTNISLAIEQTEVPSDYQLIKIKASGMSGGHSGIDIHLEKAISVGRLLEDNGICHFEEPCPYWELEWTKQVTDALKLDVTGGEQNCDLSTWKRIIEMRAVDVVQPDVCYLGGLTRTLKVAEMARQAGIPCTPHSANLSLVTVFTLHLMGALENAGSYVEFSIEGPEYYPWQYDIYEPALAAKDGKVQIPEAPGWGIEINPDFLEKTKYQISTLN